MSNLLLLQISLLYMSPPTSLRSQSPKQFRRENEMKFYSWIASSAYKPPRNDVASGFTLIEVMVALMIFAVVSVLAAQGLRVLIRSHESVRAQSDRLQELQIALTLINRNLSQTLDRSIINEQNITQPAVLGGGSYVEFTHGGYINPKGTELRSTLQRTAYFLDTKGELVQRNWAVLDRTDKTLPTDRILIEHVTGLKLRYMDAKNQYFDTWPQQGN